MNTLCVDIGLCASGIAVIERTGNKHTLIHTGIIKTAKEAKKRGIYVADDQVRRIQEITSKLKVIHDAYNPQAVVTELPHGGGKSSVAISAMSMAKTLIVVMASMWNVPLIHIRPNDIKKYVGGRKTTSKKEIQDYVCRIYGNSLGDRYLNPKSKTGYTGNFEHIADAIAAYQTAISDQHWNVVLRG